MEDDDIEISSGSSLVPLALAILAIVLGGAGLYFGLTANQRLNPLSDTMEAGSSSAARLEKDISSLDTQVSELSAQFGELNKSLDRMRTYSNLSEQTVKQLSSGVKDNRNEIVELAERINELVTRGVRPAPAPAAAVNSGGGRTEVPGGTNTSTGGSASFSGTYTIASGDTFAKIAAKFGVGLQALLDANPDADPRRLAIGQVINVPAN